jgi:hypothetical protein
MKRPKWAESLTRSNYDPGNPAVVAYALRPEALRPHLSMGLRYECHCGLRPGLRNGEFPQGHS